MYSINAVVHHLLHAPFSCTLFTFYTVQTHIWWWICARSGEAQGRWSCAHLDEHLRILRTRCIYDGLIWVIYVLCAAVRVQYVRVWKEEQRPKARRWEGKVLLTDDWEDDRRKPTYIIYIYIAMCGNMKRKRTYCTMMCMSRSPYRSRKHLLHLGLVFADIRERW